MDVLPVIQDGRTLIPVRFIAEALGATVGWNGDTNEVTIMLGGRNLTFAIGEISPELYALGMDVPAQIMDDRTMVPIRFISEFFGALVEWDEDTRGIEIVWDSAPPQTQNTAPGHGMTNAAGEAYIDRRAIEAIYRASRGLPPELPDDMDRLLTLEELDEFEL
jgi:hypothetical protein